MQDSEVQLNSQKVQNNVGNGIILVSAKNIPHSQKWRCLGLQVDGNIFKKLQI